MALMFSVRQSTQRWLSQGKVGHGQWTWYHYFVCGAAGGLAQAPFATPMEHVKVRLQVQQGKVGASTWSVVRNIVAHRGAHYFLTRGLLCTAIRDTIGYGCFLGAAEAAMSACIPSGG